MPKPPRTYETYLTTDRLKTNKLNLDEISASGLDSEGLASAFSSFLKGYYYNLFHDFVIFSWFRRNFTYYGKKMVYPIQKNGFLSNIAFVKFLRRNVGMDVQIITKNRAFHQIESYFDDFFPGFTEGNPFENPEYYKYPYENITADFLPVVYQMEERLDLLKFADEEKMTYAEFVDYVLDRVGVLNSEMEIPRYEIKQKSDRNTTFHIRDNRRYLKNKKI